MPLTSAAPFVLLAALVAVSFPRAQTATTGAITGVVRDQLAAVLPNVRITAIDESTGMRYETVTDAAGRFHVLNVRAGGPYRITARRTGFLDHTERDLHVAAGVERTITFAMRLQRLSSSVEVIGSLSAVHDPFRSGTAEAIPQQLVETLPTMQRSLTDLARVSPHFNALRLSGGEAVLSVAGRNSRYNDVQIDGSVHNDVFGLSPTGAPGGLSSAQPISLDAVQELQLVVAPYDVRHGGFTGGAINVTTKSGSNALSGGAFLFGRDRSLVGALAALPELSRSTRVGAFQDRQWGVSLGGPLVKDRVFLFGSGELNARDTPAGFSITGDSGQRWGSEATVRRALDILEQHYGFSAGTLDQFVKKTDNAKVFWRADVNLAPGRRLVARVNVLDASADTGSSSNTVYLMPSAYGGLRDNSVSIVGQVNSTHGRLFNELRIGWQRQRSRRSEGAGYSPFPNVRIDMPEGSLIAGSDGLSHANHLMQDIGELTDDLTWVRGRHVLTLGTHNELLRFDNLFIQNVYGAYRFSSVDNLDAGVAQAFSRSFSTTADPRQSTRVAVRQFGFYAGDRWHAHRNLALTFGLRADVPRFPRTPRANPALRSEFGYATDVVPTPWMWSPRAGFTLALDGRGTRGSRVRGGIGVFAGRPPYVWLANQYGNTGLDFTTRTLPFAAANRIAFVADPFDQPSDVGGALRQTVNLVDPSFHYPQSVRSNLAYDVQLPWTLTVTGEVLLSTTLNDVAYSNLNLVPSGMLPDGRLTYARKNPTLNDVILLANTSAGRQWSATVKVERPLSRGLYAAASYLYNRALSVTDGTGAIAASNWGSTPIGVDANNPPLTRSIYEAGHRVNVMAVGSVRLFRRLRGTASAVYIGQSGQPYVLVFNRDANGDDRLNDIVFVPATPEAVLVTGGTWDQLHSYLAADASTRSYRGRTPPRNAGRSPWTHGLDLRFALDIPTGGRTKLALTADVANALNLFNDRWGWVFYPSGNAPATIGFAGLDAATGKQIYNVSILTAPTFAGTFVRDDLSSRWQIKWGGRFRF